MEHNGIITAYHGTDEKYLPDILKNGFKIKNNKHHWLGHGIYFYFDYELAKWWSHSPTSQFGNQNDNPVVIKAEIKSNTKNTIDTRVLDDYKTLLEMYNEFFNELCMKGTVVEKINSKVLRCMFFDWVHNNYENINVFIAGFEKKKKHKNNNQLKGKFQIPYIEYQICVFDNNLIISKERMNDYEQN